MRECKADQFEGCDIVFSGLDSDVAGDIGKRAGRVGQGCDEELW